MLYLYKKISDDAAELEQSWNTISSGDFCEVENDANHKGIEHMFDETEDNNSSKDEGTHYSPNKQSVFQLKKRQRMMKISYKTGHGINKKVLPVVSFTFEEEFRVMDYMVRIEQYQNKRFNVLNKNFQR